MMGGGNANRFPWKTYNKKSQKVYKRQPGLLQTLFNREIHGCLPHSSSNRQAVANNLLHWRHFPVRLVFRLSDLLNEYILQAGYVFLGFSRDGQFVLSYTQEEEADDDEGTFPVISQYVYKLQWWCFVPYQPLKKVSEVRLFGEQDITQDLHITICQWPANDSMILIYGRSTHTETHDVQLLQCYMTITAVPSLARCTECDKLAESVTRDDTGISSFRASWEPLQPCCCLQHGFALHTRYYLASPYPAFTPPICLKIDRVVVINTGDSIIMLSVEPQNLSLPEPTCRTDLSDAEDLEDFHLSSPAYTTSPESPDHSSFEISPTTELPHEVESIVVKESGTRSRKRAEDEWEAFVLSSSGNNSNRNLRLPPIRSPNSSECVCPKRQGASCNCNLSKSDESAERQSSNSYAHSTRVVESVSTSTTCLDDSHESSTCVCNSSGSSSNDNTQHVHGSSKLSSTPEHSNTSPWVHDRISPDHRKTRRRSQDENECSEVIINKKCKFGEVSEGRSVTFSCELAFDTQGSMVIMGGSTVGKSPRVSSISAIQSDRKTSLEAETVKSDSKFLEDIKLSQDTKKVIGEDETSAQTVNSSPRSLNFDVVVQPQKRREETLKEKENISPDRCSHQSLKLLYEKHMHVDVLEGRDPYSFPEAISKRSGDLALLSPPVPPSTSSSGCDRDHAGAPVPADCVLSLDRLYVEFAGVSEALDLMEEEEVPNPGYNSSLPLDVHGSGYEPMQLVSPAKIDKMSHPCVLVKQLTFDIEQYIHEVAPRLCAQAGKKYLAFTDYDIQIVDVCPETGDVLLLSLVLVQATVKNKGLAKSQRNISSVVRKSYQTGFKFIWNINTGEYSIVDLDDLKEIDPLQISRRSRVWNPAFMACTRLQTQWLLQPQAYMNKVLVMTNGAVFRGVSEKSLVDRFHHVVLVP